MNKVTLIGNVGKGGIKVHELPNKNAVANFSLATNEKWEDKEGQQQQSTDWHTIKVWGDLAKESAEKFSQGTFVKVNGKLKKDLYEDKEGNKRASTYVLALGIEKVEAKQEQEQLEPAS